MKKRARHSSETSASAPAPRARAAPLTGDEPRLAFATKAEWAAWLAENHATTRAVRVVFARKGTGKGSLSYPEAVEVALAWGWIDGQSKSLDEASWMQRFTPRTARSPWSKLNRERALALIARGEMAPPGLAAVERAKVDGRWDAAYDAPSTAAVPDDLAAALARSRRAAALFAELDKRNRYAVLHRVQTAPSAASRAARIAKLVAMLARGEAPHPRR